MTYLYEEPPTTADVVSALGEFLLARKAEDAAVARDVLARADGGRRGVEEGTVLLTCGEQGWHVAMSPARVLADCETTRRIVHNAKWITDHGLGGIGDYLSFLRILAKVYSDHPDYREEWHQLTETQTLTLTEFLLARIAEDEAKVAEDDYSTFGMRGGIDDIADERGGSPYLTITPARVLAECEAKRRIVEMAQETLATSGHGFPNDDSGYEEAHSMASATLRALASVHSDHPDYLEEWRP